jgi:hypothetical protein
MGVSLSSKPAWVTNQDPFSKTKTKQASFSSGESRTLD